MQINRKLVAIVLTAMVVILNGCTNPVFPPLTPSQPLAPFTTDHEQYKYIVGPGDSLNIFVWRNPEVSTSATVRPDGYITAPLVEDLKVSEKTPTEIARLYEKALGEYIKDPIVSVTVGGFIGPYREQVRVIGEAASPQALPYKEHMTLLDLMIVVGGLTDFADGDKAILSRVIEDHNEQYTVRIESLIQDGDLSANVNILPGDILIIPEAWF